MQADRLESQMRVQLEIQEGIDFRLEQRDKQLRQLRSQSQADGAQLAALSLCQEIGLVAFMFFFELLFSYVSSSISFDVSLTNLFSIISFPYLLITRDIQNEGKARFRFY